MFPTASVGRRTAFALFMSLCPHPLVTAATATRETSFTAAAKIDQLLASTFRSDGPGAAVIVVQNGNIVVRQGYGMADLELGVPMDATNVLPVCSITKQFTAVAILQLVDAGKLKLDDTLSELVPEYPTQAPVTIEQLLRHTSGIPSLEEDPAAVRRFAEDLTPAQILDYTRNKPLGFAPGTDWKYSNTGYYLLGRVIEKVSGQSYADYVTTHVLAPAGMTHSAYADGKRIITKRVRGYSRSGKNWIDAPLFNFKQADSAGAIVSTVDDLWTWEQALQSGKLVGQALLQRAYTDVLLPDGRATRYGFGWEVTQIAGRSMIGHAGGTFGFAAFEARLPEAGLYVAVLCNTDAPPVDLRQLATQVVHLVLGEALNAAPAAVTLAPAALEEFVGSYQAGPGATFDITSNGGALIGHLGRGQRRLIALGDDEFAIAQSRMHFRVVRDQAHRVTKLFVTTDGAGPDLIWPRVNPSPEKTGDPAKPHQAEPPKPTP